MAEPLPVIEHQVIPENLKTNGYVEFDQVDFVLTFSGRAIDLGSIRLEGEFEALYDGNFLSSGLNNNGVINEKDICLDPLVGAHSVCEQWSTTLQGSAAGSAAGQIENITEYPRYVKMSTAAASGVDDMNNASHVCEMKAPYREMTNSLLQGVVPVTQPTSPIRINPDFSIRPSICLNAGQGSVPYSRTGDIRLTVTLARNAAVFNGIDVDANVSYKLRDLRVTFRSSPEEMGSKEPVAMKTKLHIKQSIQSSFANVQTKVPAEVMAVSCSFQPQGEENTFKNNNLQLSKLPDLIKTNFNFNDATNQLVSYEIKNNVELVGRFIDSFMDTGRNSLSTQKLANNHGFGIGIDLGQVVNLVQSKFGIQLTSSIDSTIPFIIYMYFHSFVEV